MQRSYRRERYLDWLERDPRRDPRHRRLDRHHRGVPRRDRGGLRRRRSTWSSVPASTARSRSSTRRGPGTRAATMDGPGARRRSCRSASTGSWRCRRGSPRRAEPGAGRARRSRSSWRATGRRTAPPRRGPGRTGSCTCAEPLAPGTFVDARITEAGAHHLLGEVVAGARARRRRDAPRPGRADRQRQDRGGDRAGDGARRRDRLGRLDARVPGDGHRHGEADRRAAGARCPITCSIWRSRRSGSPWRASRRRRARCSAGSTDPLLVGGSGLYFRAVVDELRVPAGGPGGAGRARGRGRRAGRRRAVPAAGRDRSGRRGPDRAGERPPHDPGARGRPRSPGRRSAPSPRRGRSTTRRACGSPASGWTRPIARRPGAGARRGDARGRLARRGARPRRRGGSAPGSPPARRSATRSSRAHLDGRLALDEAMEQTVKRTKELARRQIGVVPPRPADPLVRRRRGRRAWRSLDDVAGLPGGARERALRFASTRPAGTTSCSSTSSTAPVGELDVAGAVRPVVRASAPTALIRVGRGTAAPFALRADERRRLAGRDVAATACAASGAWLRDREHVAHGDVLRRRDPGRRPPRAGSTPRGRHRRRWASRTSRRRRSRCAGPAWETFQEQPFDVGDGRTMRGDRAEHGQPAPGAVHRRGPRALPPGAHRAGARAPRAVPRADERRVRARSRPTAGSTCASGSAGSARRWRAARAPARSPWRRTRPAWRRAQVTVRFRGGPLHVERRSDGEVLLGGPVAHVFDAVDRPRRARRMSELGRAAGGRHARPRRHRIGEPRRGRDPGRAPRAAGRRARACGSPTTTTASSRRLPERDAPDVPLVAARRARRHGAARPARRAPARRDGDVVDRSRRRRHEGRRSPCMLALAEDGAPAPTSISATCSSGARRSRSRSRRSCRRSTAMPELREAALAIVMEPTDNAARGRLQRQPDRAA